jgi:hypothetical protein
MALLNRYSRLATTHPRHPVAIPYLTQGKQPQETPVKISARSNGRIKNYGLFEPILKVADQTSLSQNIDSIAYPTKTGSGNPCKNLSVIQWSDQNLWPFWVDTEVRPTTHTRHQNCLWKPLQKFERDPTVGSNVMVLLNRYSRLAPRHPRHSTAIP